MGGGGDGGAGQLRADEAARQAKVRAAVDAVNNTFSGANREAMYTDIADATRGVATRDLDKQFGTASKQNLFGLARAGLLGGSVDAEAGGDLQQRYGEGKIRAEQAGVGAASAHSLYPHPDHVVVVREAQAAQNARHCRSGARLDVCAPRFFDPRAEGRPESDRRRRQIPAGQRHHVAGRAPRVVAKLEDHGQHRFVTLVDHDRMRPAFLDQLRQVLGRPFAAG